MNVLSPVAAVAATLALLSTPVVASAQGNSPNTAAEDVRQNETRPRPPRPRGRPSGFPPGAVIAMGVAATAAAAALAGAFDNDKGPVSGKN